MPLLIGLLSPVFTHRMGPINFLLLALAAAQPTISYIAAIRSMSMLLMAVITIRQVSRSMFLR